jgi:phosphopantothenoylcysteine decarboxylase/phosphopantothenate--cysteine ligase
MDTLRGRHLLLCIGGGIAAYKVAELARLLVKAGSVVRTAMTPAAQEFIAPLTFQALTGHAPATSVFGAGQEMAAGHVAFADWAELALVAPCTADLLGRLRAGLANDAVTTTLLAISPARWLLAPAMNERMWASPAVQENLAVLRDRGAAVVGPEVGEMAERSHVGPGRMSEPAQILAAASRCMEALAAAARDSSGAPRPPPSSPRRDLAGLPVLVTAGPTREHLDPVRFLSNPSTGRMGFALAEAARDRGAQVVLVSGPTDLAAPAGLELLRVTSAEEMAAAVADRAGAARVVVMAAAVCDQRPAVRHAQKVKKPSGDEPLLLVRTPDILAGLGARFAGQALGAGPEGRPLLVGFAAETELVEEQARRKLVQKGIDLICANDVSAPGAGFAAEENRVLLLGRDGTREELEGSKVEVADRIWDAALRLLAAGAGSPASPAP